MAVSSKALANYLLDLAEAEGIPVSPMKLQKLVYYCQGWHLAIVGKPLIDEQVEAWKFGPVVETLFHEFKRYGKEPIESKAIRFVKSDSEESFLGLESIVPSIDSECTDTMEADNAKRVAKKVWDVYKVYSAERLSNMTHKTGTPWEVTVARFDGNPPKGTDIPADLISQHFEELLNQRLSANEK
jgi:uncharacterized phage-associated protein